MRGKPMAFWIIGAIPGANRSGVMVAVTKASTSGAASPASPSAAIPAWAPSWEAPTPGSANRRCSTPLRDRIQSSETSITRPRSSLVTIRSGSWTPVPAMTLPIAIVCAVFGQLPDRTVSGVLDSNPERIEPVA